MATAIVAVRDAGTAIGGLGGSVGDLPADESGAVAIRAATIQLGRRDAAGRLERVHRSVVPLR